MPHAIFNVRLGLLAGSEDQIIANPMPGVVYDYIHPVRHWARSGPIQWSIPLPSRRMRLVFTRIEMIDS